MKLQEALAALTQADLDDVNTQCETLEKQIDDLKELRKIIEIKLGVRKPIGAHLKNRGPRKPKADQTAGEQSSEPQISITEQYRIKAKTYIMAYGPSKPTAIAKGTGIPIGSITAVLSHKWFMTTEDGVKLTHHA